MPVTNYIVIDTLTELFLLTYSTKLESCTFTSDVNDAMLLNQTQQTAICNNLNAQSYPGRFVGQNPPPR